MARLFSWKPSLTYRGRKFKGLRGWSGKPLHPPLTDIPVAAYFIVAFLDLISFLKDGRTATDFFRAGTYVIIAGGIVSLPTALTGFWDWLKSTPKGSQTWRTANVHMAIMLTVTALVLVNIVIRLGSWEDGAVSGTVLALSLLIGGLVSLGALFGGTLVYEYAFNVEQNIDYAYESSETDVFPGQK